MKRPKVFVIVLSWNSAGRIRVCLDSLVRQRYDNLHVVVIDNASTDASCAIVRSEYPACHLIENSANLGYTGGNNIGIAYALANGANYVWLFNDDASADEGALESLISVMEADPMLGMVSPVVCFRRDPGRVQFAGSYLDDVRFDIVGTSQPAQMQAWIANHAHKVLLWGTALVIRADTIRAIGSLDDRYFAYYEDSDICMRAIRAGYHARLVPEARVLHDSYQTTVSRPPHFHYLMIRNEYRFWLSYLPARRRAQFRLQYFSKTLKTIGRCKESASSEHVDACIAGLWDALCDAYGARDISRRMPSPLRRALLWKPYFLAMLLEGDLRGITAELRLRLRKGETNERS
jgi:GT2 family glycosyltransferase